MNVIVAGHETTLQALIIDKAKISSADQQNKANTNIKDHDATARLVLKNPKTTLVRLDAILDEYNIPEQKRMLRICIDKVLIRDPSKILADLSYIRRVELTTDRYPAYTNEVNTEEEVINIITFNSFNPG